MLSVEISHIWSIFDPLVKVKVMCLLYCSKHILGRVFQKKNTEKLLISCALVAKYETFRLKNS